MTDFQLPIAAVRFGHADRIDDLLETVVRSVRMRGFSVAGYLQCEVADGPDCCPVTYLEDISTGARIRISQALGSGSRGCRLDPQAMAELAGRLLPHIGEQTDLLVLNRFGKGESDGHGFRDVIQTACGFGVPVLTAVRTTYEPAWVEFTGTAGRFLSADPASVASWALASITTRREPLSAA